MRLLGILLTFCLAGWSLSAPTCSPVWGRTVEQFVADANFIVIAKAIGYGKFDAESINVYGPHKSTVRFKVIEVLAGSSKVKSIELIGALSDTDDFNDGSVPYQMVRPNGRHGGCYAYHYHADALYLLILKKQDGQLTPYWDPLKPSNEQIRSATDPWVGWVKAYLARIWQIS
jgi:hypothetical protein